MRVLFWSEVFWPHIGGAQLFAARLLPALQERNHEFIVVTRHDELDLPNESTFSGIPVYRFPFHSALLTGNVDQLVQIRRQVVELKRTFAPELIHVNAFGPSVLFHLDTTEVRIAPLLLTLHGERYPPAASTSTLLERTVRAASWVTVPSEATVEYARRLIPGFVPRISVVHNAVEMPTLAPRPLPFDAPRLLCLGRLVHEKGFGLALSAFASVAGRFPGARLVIAGDGPMRDELECQIAELGMTAKVDLVGWVAPENVAELINTSTLVVMPSRREALPLVALEAALMARPLIATRVGGLTEVVLHQETGLLVESEDCQGIADAVTFLLDHPETAVKMGQAARRRVTEVFSFERHVAAFDSLYGRLAADTDTRHLELRAVDRRGY